MPYGPHNHCSKKARDTWSKIGNVLPTCRGGVFTVGIRRWQAIRDVLGAELIASASGRYLHVSPIGLVAPIPTFTGFEEATGALIKSSRSNLRLAEPYCHFALLATTRRCILPISHRKDVVLEYYFTMTTRYVFGSCKAGSHIASSLKHRNAIIISPVETLTATIMDWRSFHLKYDDSLPLPCLALPCLAFKLSCLTCYPTSHDVFMHSLR